MSDDDTDPAQPLRADGSPAIGHEHPGAPVGDGADPAAPGASTTSPSMSELASPPPVERLRARPRPHDALVPLRTLPVPAPVPDPNDPDAIPGMVAIGPVASERKARDWALVLQSQSVWHAIRRTYAGWVLLVRDEDYASAAQSIDHYEAENRDWPPRPTRERARHASSTAVPVIFALLAAFFLVTGPAAGGSFWFDRGVAVADRVLTTQPWRAVTALTLHADAVHVMGNAISGTVFVSAVQRRLGTGGAALAVLATGVAGNVANALYHHLTVGQHASLGASTAIFGAIGLLAATQLVLDRPTRDGGRTPRTWISAIAPIIGGFALLGALGAGGERTDLGAHFFGFLAGVLLGLAVAFPLRRATLSVDVATGHHGHEVALGAGAPRWWVQATLGALAAAIIVVSWMAALR